MGFSSSILVFFLSNFIYMWEPFKKNEDERIKKKTEKGVGDGLGVETRKLESLIAYKCVE